MVASLVDLFDSSILIHLIHTIIDSPTTIPAHKDVKKREDSMDDRIRNTAATLSKTAAVKIERFVRYSVNGCMSDPRFPHIGF